MAENSGRKFGKWHMVVLVVALYVLVVLVGLFSPQPQATMNKIFEGAAGVGILVFAILVIGGMGDEE